MHEGRHTKTYGAKRVADRNAKIHILLPMFTGPLFDPFLTLLYVHERLVTQALL
jgi:hypothetical protein